MADKQELDFKRYVRKNWPYWSCAYEPGIGGNDGYPDLQLMHPENKRLLPIELKIGEIKGDKIYSKNVRGTQNVWHRQFHLAGGYAALLIGVKVPSGWCAYAFPGHFCENWRDGFDLDCGWGLSDLSFAADLAQMVDIFTSGKQFSCCERVPSLL